MICVRVSIRLKSTIFKGVSVYIDGHTQVPYQTLRQLICDHGGHFDPYFYGTGTTHFVAENVSHARMRRLLECSIRLNPRKEIKDMYIVTPEWITESVKEGRRLGENGFSLLKVSTGIPRILSLLL